MKLSQYIARFLRTRDVDLVFTITGAGNVRLIEAVHEAGIKYVCPHHEQAAVMSALTYLRASGKPAVCIVTGGPGAANTLIAVADAFLDSLPCIIIAGQEKLEFVQPPNRMRGKGVQGLDMVNIMSSVTKSAFCVTRPGDIRSILEEAFHVAYAGRPGPVWVDVPQDLQWAEVDPERLATYRPVMEEPVGRCDMRVAAARTLDMLAQSKRPLLWAGHGIRLSGCEAAFRQMFDSLGVPALVSWQAADLVPDDHPLYVGRAGTYGQRWANLALQNCDLLITLGTRLAIPQRGYADSEFARGARKVIVEIDPDELNKFTFPVDVPALGDVKDFIGCLTAQLPASTASDSPAIAWEAWLRQCKDWRDRYPMAQPPAHQESTDSNAGINSYWFIDRLSDLLSPDDVIVTDMGASLTCTHATLRIKPGQRLMTSTGLGEMGFGLPGAIGAALGSPSRRVVLIAGEGSLMMNLQELQTLRHQRLPVKIFLLNNNGYLTIKHTHNALFSSRGTASATSPQTGVSFPDFAKVATAFGIEYSKISEPSRLDEWIKSILDFDGSIIAEITMPEFQELIPKSSIKVRSDGSIYSPPLEDLYPFLDPAVLASEMIIPPIAQ